MNFIILAVFLTMAAPVVKQGQCPSGYSSSASYCAPTSGSKQAVPKPNGQQCPSGWHQSGNYCLPNR